MLTKRLKLSIIGTFASGAGVIDADTGRPDTGNRQAKEPIRVLLPEPWERVRSVGGTKPNADLVKRRQRSLRGWAFKNKLIHVDGWEALTREEIVTNVKHRVLHEEGAFKRMQHEIELFEKVQKMPLSPQRERIPDDVKMFVWRRDEGRCARCGSRERIEFDHIIPVAEGGSNTARNIEILCERHNRAKGAEI